ncbi:hypothetical protein N9I43_00185 [bacterium]|nr:hypothetical protein [bacterium]
MVEADFSLVNRGMNAVYGRMIRFLVWILFLPSILLGHSELCQLKEAGLFRFEQAEHEQPLNNLGSPHFYDSSIFVFNRETRVVFLEHILGKGDRLMSGNITNGKLVGAFAVFPGVGTYKNPTVTVDAASNEYLSWEEFKEDRWQVMATRLKEGKPSKIMVLNQPASFSVNSSATAVNRSFGNGINHATAPHPLGGLSIVWQQDVGGQFDIAHASVSVGLEVSEQKILSNNSRGDWAPRIATNEQGKSFVAWDSYHEQSFDVLGCWVDKKGSDPFALTDGPLAQFRADIIFVGEKLFVLWEEAAANWGKDYDGGFGQWTNIEDHYGPLHKFRLLRVAEVVDGQAVELQNSLPHALLNHATVQKDQRDSLEQLGVFYERGQFVTDGQGRLWLVHRSFHAPHVRTNKPVIHHIESGWQVQARCFDGENWSRLYSFEHPQRDGLQRMSVVPAPDGFYITYTTGRTHRSHPSAHRGVFFGSVEMESFNAEEKQFSFPITKPARLVQPSAPTTQTMTNVGGKSYQLSFGDLHRHTDLSLCFPFFDGSYDDQFRYVIEVAEHDFVGITDHARDLSNGQVDSLVWRRSVKEVTRHRLNGGFIPYFAYERSQSQTDHNVISLRDDLLRPFEPHIRDFWKEIDGDTFTIPHNTGRTPAMVQALWSIHDNEKRPLMEIFQGCRANADQNMAAMVRLGYSKGYRFGLIASSDHLSTHRSYACVWSPKRERESIFRSLQSRRTYGATDRIGLVFRYGQNWMGEEVKYRKKDSLFLQITGTRPVKEVRVIKNGKPWKSFMPAEQSLKFEQSLAPDPLDEKEDYYFVELEQSDGNRAWSSPIWIVR